jgi:hypothetical protein
VGRRSIGHVPISEFGLCQKREGSWRQCVKQADIIWLQEVLEVDVNVILRFREIGLFLQYMLDLLGKSL